MELSESESREVARLCILRDWVSLEFIRASRVTWNSDNFYPGELLLHSLACYSNAMIAINAMIAVSFVV